MDKQLTNPMAEHVTLKVIARIHTPFPSKFGVPRQSGLVNNVESKIVFEPEYRNLEALRGIEGYDYLWLIWSFSEAIRKEWSPTVRPPRMGGNVRMGVFATRSPYRPNPLALSSVRLLRIEETDNDGWVLVVEGADMMDGTPIYDIKPYLPFTDSHQNVSAGFADQTVKQKITVDFPPMLLQRLPESLQSGAVEMLEQNPVPQYQKDPDRMYGVNFSKYDIHFYIKDDVLRVVDVVEKTDI